VFHHHNQKADALEKLKIFEVEHTAFLIKLDELYLV
jgi:hypothetical protein